jgi:CPW-WPC domain-containing protein
MNAIWLFACLPLIGGYGIVTPPFRSAGVWLSCIATFTITEAQMDPLTAALGPGGIASMGSIGQMAPLSFAPNPSASALSSALAGMANLPPSVVDPLEVIDPNLMSDEFACERNYNAKCPRGFVPIGNVLGDGPRCGPDRRIYSGPCKDRTIKFARLTVRAKQHWAILCGFSWPCNNCKRDYSKACPREWDQDPPGDFKSTVCRARESYEGPCDRLKDFQGYNDITKEEWALDCVAYWDCVK